MNDYDIVLKDEGDWFAVNAVTPAGEEFADGLIEIADIDVESFEKRAIEYGLRIERF